MLLRDSATSFIENFSSKFPSSGLPKWLTSKTFALFSRANLIVGIQAFILDASATIPSLIGTFISTLITRFLFVISKDVKLIIN